MGEASASQIRFSAPTAAPDQSMAMIRMARTLHCAVTQAVQESGWTYLSEDFIQDLERAIEGGSTISSVLQEYGINRGTYYSWIAIGEGRMTHWRDGTPISADMRTNCRRLYKRVLRAREAALRAKRQAVR